MDPRFGIIHDGRYKALQISLSVFVGMLEGPGNKPGYRVVKDWLPIGARPVHCYIDYINMKRTIFLVIESEEFPFVPIGSDIPLLLPVIQEIHAMPGNIKKNAKAKEKQEIDFEDDEEDGESN